MIATLDALVDGRIVDLEIGRRAASFLAVDAGQQRRFPNLLL
jgi:hypothetical protein